MADNVYPQEYILFYPYKDQVFSFFHLSQRNKFFLNNAASRAFLRKIIKISAILSDNTFTFSFP